MTPTPSANLPDVIVTERPDPFKPILVISMSRSGGKLIRTLFDDHPEMRALPFEHWQTRAKAQFKSSDIDTFRSLSPERRLQVCGFDHAEAKIRKLHAGTFVDLLLAALRADAACAVAPPDLFAALGRRYFAALGYPETPYRLVNHCGSLCLLSKPQIDALFGEASHLLSVRDPRATWVSMEGMRFSRFTLRHYLRGTIPRPVLEWHLEMRQVKDGASLYLRQFCDSYRALVRNHASAAGIVLLRFEDLVNDPEGTTKKLARELDVAWHATLLNPTQLGRPRTANTSFSRRAGIDANAASDWTARITPGDREYIERTLSHEMSELGYR